MQLQPNLAYPRRDGVHPTDFTSPSPPAACARRRAGPWAGRWRAWIAAAAVVLAGPQCAALQGAEAAPACVLQTQYLRLEIGGDGRNLHFIDKQTGKDYCAAASSPFAKVRKAGKEFAASAVSAAEGRLQVAFGDSGVRATLQAHSRPRYLVLEVVAVEGESIDELALCDIPLALRGSDDEPFAACALALNLRTNVLELPRLGSRLRATCYPRFGMPGAQVALVGCPPAALREILQEAVSSAPELPHSPLGGPWALDQRINRGSYLFNFDGITEQNADEWIKLAQRLGMSQIDFHGGHTFRFGDCRPHPTLYPQAFASLKAATDKLHAAGISAGLHTYAFFIAKNCPWVTPVPDPRLASDATFTLAADLPAQANAVSVLESTEKMSAITGFFVRNSVTLRIEEELITYSGASKQAPFQFTGCQRGACGTKVAAHAKGAKVHHLKECFGLFVPDPETTLFAEVAASTAGAFNEGGFDMIYFDALDGEDILGGAANGWHYGSKFVFEVWKRLQKPALIEMSTFHHHLWYVRSRLCAWDHPTRSHKKFIDLHCADNENSRRIFLPGELGWWALKSWSGPQGEPTFADDIEYLMTKALATDTGSALMGIDPRTATTVPALPRLAAIIKRYEDLRHSGQVPESIRARLRVPGAEFTLVGGLPGPWQFIPVDYAKHRVEDAAGPSAAWQTVNHFERQPLRLRIEALMGAGPYDAPGSVTVADFQSPAEFADRAGQSGVIAELKPSQEIARPGTPSGCFTATSTHPNPKAAWTKAEKHFSPPLDLSKTQALGVWIHGDGQGQLLNFQLRSPHHVAGGIGDHYVPIDFTGWRYFELIEPEGARHADYQWPYGGLYAIYRESPNFGAIESLSLWLNNLSPGKKASCYLSPIKALPLVSTKLIRPSITVGGATLVFPVEIESGQYLEFNSPADCKLYGPQGQLLRELKPEGPLPELSPGANAVRFQCGSPPGGRARAQITIITQGQPLKP